MTREFSSVPQREAQGAPMSSLPSEAATMPATKKPKLIDLTGSDDDEAPWVLRRPDCCWTGAEKFDDAATRALREQLYAHNDGSPGLEALAAPIHEALGACIGCAELAIVAGGSSAAATDASKRFMVLLQDIVIKTAREDARRGGRAVSRGHRTDRPPRRESIREMCDDTVEPASAALGITVRCTEPSRSLTRCSQSSPR